MCLSSASSCFFMALVTSLLNKRKYGIDNLRIYSLYKRMNIKMQTWEFKTIIRIFWGIQYLMRILKIQILFFFNIDFGLIFATYNLFENSFIFAGRVSYFAFCFSCSISIARITSKIISKKWNTF